MKKRDVILAVAFAALLILSACSKLASVRQEDADTLISKPEQDITSDVQPELVPEPEQESKDTALPEQDDPAAPQEEPEEQHFPMPSPEVLKLRLQNASVCTCLMEEGARWRLVQLGVTERDSEDAFLSALDAMEAALTAHPEDFAAVAENTAWLLDRAPDGSLALHFLQADQAGSVSCRSLVFDGVDVTWQSDALRLESLYWAPCSNRASDGERQRIQEEYEQFSGTFPSYFWRVSLESNDKLALTRMSIDDAQASVSHHNAYTDGPLIVNAEDIKPWKEVDELLLTCIRMTPDSSVVRADEIILLRAFLAQELLKNDDVIWIWDTPVPQQTEYSMFYMVRNALELFLRDLRADDTLKEAFLLRADWTLSWDNDECIQYILRARGTEGSLIAHLYSAGVDVEGLKTPSRKNFEQLAMDAENSDQISEDVIQQFVLGVMRDLQFGRMMSGEFGSVQWSWRVNDGQPQLVVADASNTRVLAYFAPDARGIPSFVVVPER